SSIAFGQPKPILDGNVIRVLTRLYGIRKDPRAKNVNEQLWRLAEELVTEAGRKDCSRLKQSLIELGGLVCTPKQPRCDECPLASRCVARRKGWAESLPIVARRPKVTKRRFFAFVARSRGRFLVRQRSAGIVNAHLWEFPNVEVLARAEATKAAQAALGWKP